MSIMFSLPPYIVESTKFHIGQYSILWLLYNLWVSCWAGYKAHTMRGYGPGIKLVKVSGSASPLESLQF